MPRKPFAAWTVIAVLGLMFLAAACGGGEEEPAATTTPDAVDAGTTVSPTPTATPTMEFTTYTVESGDTALEIAFSFDITLAELATANGMTEEELNDLQIGQELRIPR